MNPRRGLLHHMLINVRNVERSSPFYSGMLGYFGYELADSSYGEDYGFEDWKRWDLETPHEISICQVARELRKVRHVRGALGHHDHISFFAASRQDVDDFHLRVLAPLEAQGHCRIEDPPCECPEYGEGDYAAFFYDPDGLKYEYALNPNHGIKKALRASGPADMSNWNPCSDFDAFTVSMRRAWTECDFRPDGGRRGGGGRAGIARWDDRAADDGFQGLIQSRG